MYSACVKLLSSAAEEMAESITEEEGEYLKKKYNGMSLQKILYESSDAAILDYILHTKKQRETLKIYSPDTRRAELKLAACLHLEASLNMFQELLASSYIIDSGTSGKTMLGQAIQTHHRIMHPKLSWPLDNAKDKIAEAADFFDTLGFPYNPLKL